MTDTKFTLLEKTKDGSTYTFEIEQGGTSMALAITIYKSDETGEDAFATANLDAMGRCILEGQVPLDWATAITEHGADEDWLDRSESPVYETE